MRAGQREEEENEEEKEEEKEGWGGQSYKCKDNLL